REFEVLRANAWHDLAGARWLGFANLVDLVDQKQRALVPPEILDRLRHFAFLDQECSIARETGEEHGALVEEANIEKVRDQNPALAAGDQLRGALRATDEFDRPAP